MNTWMEDQFAGASAVVDHATGAYSQADLQETIVLGEIAVRQSSSLKAAACLSISDLAHTA
jgi:hypothetical protein